VPSVALAEWRIQKGAPRGLGSMSRSYQTLGAFLGLGMGSVKLILKLK
jgi:hypothetical protein